MGRADVDDDAHSGRSPDGAPDFVHRVTALPGSSKLAARQVHP